VTSARGQNECSVAKLHIKGKGQAHTTDSKIEGSEKWKSGRVGGKHVGVFEVLECM
jgi:hypothetical protein